jgi:hypothetical protein
LYGAGMIENYLSGLFWELFMKIPEIQNGLRKPGFCGNYFKIKPVQFIPARIEFD